MEIVARSLVFSKILKVKFEVNEDTLESILEESEDETLFGFESITDFKHGYSNEESIELLKRYPDSIKIVEGGRVDILMRTPEERLQELNAYMLEGDRLTVFERLVDTLKKAEEESDVWEYTEMMISLDSHSSDALDQALRILELQERD